MYPDAYIEGIRLFNRGRFWHAHEQWEVCWLGTDEPDNTFYKGIIQAAGALYHWQKGNPRGLHRNWAKSRAKLLALPTPYMGLDLRAFVANMDRFVPAHQHEPAAPFPPLLLLNSTDNCS